METLFLKLLNMSLTGAAVILAVCLLRLALRRSPKAISYALWAVVLFRLLCPVSLSSELSAFNLVSAPVRGVSAAASAVEFVEPGVEGPAPVNVPEMAEQAAAERVPAPAKGPEPAELAAWVWLAGTLAMACWGLASYLRLRRRLVGAVPLGGGVFASDYIGTPFVLGLFRPRIYLPSSLPERERGYILLHERRHIRRLDPLFRLLGFAALCLHWFNPLVWLAFVLSGRDMEMSCDEAVLRTLGEGVRADYSVSLLRLASGGRPGPCMSLAFGGGDTRGRIKNLGRWKKPARWAVILAAAAVAVAAVCLLTNPSAPDEPEVDPILDAAILKAVSENNLQYGRDEGGIFAAYEPFVVEALDNGGYTVYAAVSAVLLRYDEDGTLDGRSPAYTWHIAELSFRTDGNGGLRLTGYWRPDPERYYEEMLARFPEEASIRAFNLAGISSNLALDAEAMARALEETGIDPAPRIDSLFAQLEAGGSEDGGAWEAIQANFLLYQELLLYGSRTLDYCKAALKDAEGLRAELLEYVRAGVEGMFDAEALYLSDPLDTRTELTFERVEDGQVVETLEITDAFEQVTLLTHSLGLEGSPPSGPADDAELGSGYVERVVRDYGGGSLHVYRYYAEDGQYLCSVESSSGRNTGYIPQETYEGVAALFE